MLTTSPFKIRIIGENFCTIAIELNIGLFNDDEDCLHIVSEVKMCIVQVTL